MNVKQGEAAYSELYLLRQSRFTIPDGAGGFYVERDGADSYIQAYRCVYGTIEELRFGYNEERNALYWIEQAVPLTEWKMEQAKQTYRGSQPDHWWLLL